MRKVILNSAMSIDGFIAGPDGDVEWLHDADYELQGEDYGMAAFYKGVDTTLMGHSTYRAILGFDVPFPYPDTANYVFTRSPGHRDTEHVRFITGDVADFVRQLARQEGKDIWLVGGGKLNATLLERDLIDELQLTVIPCILGQGIPLFDGTGSKVNFRLTATRSYESGLVQMTYKRVR